MELTRTNDIFSSIVMVLFLCRNKSSRNDLKLQENIFEINKKYWRKNQLEGTHTLSTRVEGTPLERAPALWVPWRPPDPNSNSIYSCSGEKMKEKDSSRFTIQSRRQALKPLGRADLESVRGSGEGNPLPYHHRQPSSITNFMMLTVVHE